MSKVMNDSVPEIDLGLLMKDGAGRRSYIVDEVRCACKEWGFFKIVNHGIPTTLMNKVIEVVKEFHEQDAETKKQYCTTDYKKKVVYYSNFNASTVGSGRDSLYLVMAPTPPDPLELPHLCRDTIMEYSRQIKQVGIMLLELISESLGLNPNHLTDMDCAEGQFIGCNYYPPTLEPEVEMAIGIQSHTDSSFLTILLQNEISALQVLHKDEWIDVPSSPGALIANVGDLMKFITNDLYESVYHRALLVRNAGPRISVAVFFRMHLEETSNSKVYGPIKELLSEENPPLYREAKGEEIVAVRYSKATANTPLLPFKL